MTQQQTYKIVLLGDKHSGKRSLLQHAFECPERISDFYMPIEFVEVDGKNADGNVKAYFFDSLINTKQVPEEDASFVDVFASEVLTNARAVLLCYSCTNEESLDNIIMWNRLARKHINPSTHIYLVGTKFDGAATVDDDAYEHIRDAIGNIHGDYRTSAITGENVKALFARVFNGFTELPLTMNKTELTLPMLRTPTKFNLSASRLNLSNSRLNLSHREVQTSPKNGNNKVGSYGIVLTSPKGTTSLRRVPTTNDQGSLTEMAPEREAKPASFNITISKIFGRGAAANNELRKINTPARNHNDNTFDTSLGHINYQPHNRSAHSRIFGNTQRKYEEDMFGSRNNSYSYSRLSMRSLPKAQIFSKLQPKYLEEDRTELEDETLDESAIRGKKSGKNVRVVLPSDKILNDSILLDVKYNKEDEKNFEKTPKFEVSEIKEDSRFGNTNQDSKYCVKIFF